MTISTEDRVALLQEGVLVHSVHVDSFGTRVYVTCPDEDLARGLVGARVGGGVEVTVCGTRPRERRPRGCTGHMEREAGRLQLRYELQRDEHLDEIVVAEDDERVVVFGTVCTPIDLPSGDTVEHPYHVYLDEPLGDRDVFDAVADASVPYFNVYAGIKARVAERRRAA